MLCIAPWTPFWERNYFAQLWPWIGQIMASAYLRGAVTGVGLITFAAGVRDLASAIFRRRAAADGAPGPPPPTS